MTIDPQQNALPGGAGPSESLVGDARVGKTFGQCLIQQRIGRGGMGTVYLARHLTLNKPVAVKLLRSDLLTDANGVERFLREARAAARLDHPRIVHVYDAGQQDGVYYIVMQYVPGESLATRLRRDGRLQAPEALRIFRAVAEGIKHAHSHGIVHRDIKPDNILLDSDGSVKIVDFGLAYMIEGDPNLSRTGTILGSPNFMSPEQAMGKTLDQRTDIYSLGATLYQTLTGVPPFQASSSIAVVCKVVKEPLRPPHEVNTSLSPAVSRFVCQLMHKDRDKRIPTIAEALTILDQLESRGVGGAASRHAVRPAWIVGVTSAVALILAAVAWMVSWQGASHTASASGVEPRVTSQAPVDPAPSPKPETKTHATTTPPDHEAAPQLPYGPASSLEALSPQQEKALRARFDEFKEAVGEARLAVLKALLDPEFRDRNARTLRNRPVVAVNRIINELGKGDWARAKVLGIGWEDSQKEIAVLDAEIPGDPLIRTQRWVLREGLWFLVPPPPRGPVEAERELKRE